MDLLDSTQRAPRRRPGAAAAVAGALVLLAAGQAVALTREAPLPPGTSLRGLPNGYSYATRGPDLLFGFQLANGGSTRLRVLDLAEDLPGLQLADVVVAGEPFDFAAEGAGADPLPAFDLDPGTVVEVTLVYRLQACSAVPAGAQPLPVAVRAGRASGVLRVLLPTAPSSAPDAGPDDEDEWQAVLVRDVCE